MVHPRRVQSQGSCDVFRSAQGKKLFLQSYALFNREIWLVMLSYMLPYLLIWSGSEENKDLDGLILKMIDEYLNSDCVDFAFITSIMEMFIKLKTYPLRPVLGF